VFLSFFFGLKATSDTQLRVLLNKIVVESRINLQLTGKISFKLRLQLKFALIIRLMNNIRAL